MEELFYFCRDGQRSPAYLIVSFLPDQKFMPCGAPKAHDVCSLIKSTEPVSDMLARRATPQSLEGVWPPSADLEIVDRSFSPADDVLRPSTLTACRLLPEQAGAASHRAVGFCYSLVSSLRPFAPPPLKCRQIRGARREFPTLPNSHPPVVQISLDFTNIAEALQTARIAVEAGVDWLEAGTPLLLAEGLHGVRALRLAFPQQPIVADLKTMDGGYLEAEMMAKAGATHVVVMARAHEETIKAVVRAGRDHGIQVMGDNPACEDQMSASRMMEELGVDYIVHHTGYDERNGFATAGRGRLSPDRKSTRLNSSHSQISYAVFCLKKKKTTHIYTINFLHTSLTPSHTI